MHFFKYISLIACAFPAAFATTFVVNYTFGIWTQNSTGQNNYIDSGHSIDIDGGWALVWYHTPSDRSYCDGFNFTWPPDTETVYWEYLPQNEKDPITVPFLKDGNGNAIPQKTSGIQQNCVYQCSGPQMTRRKGGGKNAGGDSGKGGGGGANHHGGKSKSGKSKSPKNKSPKDKSPKSKSGKDGNDKDGMIIFPPTGPPESSC